MLPPEEWPSGEPLPDEDVVMQDRRKVIVSYLLCKGDKDDWYYKFQMITTSFTSSCLNRMTFNGCHK